MGIAGNWSRVGDLTFSFPVIDNKTADASTTKLLQGLKKMKDVSEVSSVKFRQAATSVFSGIAVWLFFTVFYPLIVNTVLKGFEPSQYALPGTVYIYEKRNPVEVDHNIGSERSSSFPSSVSTDSSLRFGLRLGLSIYIFQEPSSCLFRMSKNLTSK